MLLKKLKKHKIILGSKSPRRRKILEKMGVDFSIEISKTDEVIDHGLIDVEIAIDIAKQKAISLSKHIQKKSIIITADTIVVFKDNIMGKPKSKYEALNMLKKLSGNMHKVITGVCITSEKKQLCFAESTQVTFRKLFIEELKIRINNGQNIFLVSLIGIYKFFKHFKKIFK